MASLRNSIQRRAHKERAQPASRKRYGLLEKHKDYVLRARDFHRKEDTIRTLQEKAAFRNPDEFYFKMEKARTKEGVHLLSTAEPNKYTQEELAVMKTQDIRYVLNKAQSEARKVERLKAALQSIGQTPVNKHIIFEDDGEYEEEENSSKEPQIEPTPELKPLPKIIEKKRIAAYRELKERSARATQMKKLVGKMSFRKELMGKGTKKKLRVEDENGSKRVVYKWKFERKK